VVRGKRLAPATARTRSTWIGVNPGLTGREKGGGGREKEKRPAIPSEPRSERNSAPRRSARHHVLLVDRSFPFLFLSFLLVFDNNSSSSRHKTTYASQLRLLPPSPPLFFQLSFPLQLSSRALGQRLPAARQQPYALLMSFWPSLCILTPSSFIPHHRNSRARRYCTKTRHSRKAARMYTRIRQPACSSRRASRPSRRIISLPPSTLFPCVFSLPLGDRPMELLSTRSWPISRESLILSRPLFITYSWMTFTLAAPILDTIERTAKMCMREITTGDGKNRQRRHEL
jgi:hypothetical protein